MEKIVEPGSQDHPADLNSSELVKRIQFQSEIPPKFFDLSNPAEVSFSEDWNYLSDPNQNPAIYTFHPDFASKIYSASTEIHEMAYLATEKVIGSDDLLEKFQIPQVFWPLLRNSWNSKEKDFWGRLDLAFQGDSIKFLEYNADCAGVIIEPSLIQDKWAKAYKCDFGVSAGAELHPELVKSWRNRSDGHRVHIFTDDSPSDELTTAIYMGTILEEAGIENKIIVHTQGLSKRNNKIVDSDGVEIKTAWKLWNWWTIFKDFLQERKDDQEVKLSDLFINNPDIKVSEPMWKFVTANKALLIVMWELFPNHPYLLEAHWDSESFENRAFVSKPILGMAGKCVTIFSNQNEILAEVEGKTGLDKNIYQEYFPVQKFGEFYPILGSWVVEGKGLGFCVREDKTIITIYDSPVLGARIFA